MKIEVLGEIENGPRSIQSVLPLIKMVSKVFKLNGVFSLEKFRDLAGEWKIHFGDLRDASEVLEKWADNLINR